MSLFIFLKIGHVLIYVHVFISVRKCHSCVRVPGKARLGHSLDGATGEPTDVGARNPVCIVGKTACVLTTEPLLQPWTDLFIFNLLRVIVHSLQI